MGNETSYGLGIYDMTEKAAHDLTEERLLPLAVKGNRLFSDEYVYGGYGWHFYVTDLDTGETSVFADMPSPEEFSGYYVLFAPDDCGFLGALKVDINTDTYEIMLFDTETAEIFFTMQVPESYRAFATENYICTCKENDSNELYIISRNG